ncbi:aminoacyl-tRNA hydrolase [Streptomyces sp. EAG2]|uniref:aminoacyl-tRNA hydrolase n=1 Tax=Streptomyces sp. EAG2 TaxID=2056495 RepID=UPI000C6EBC4B|nr:aminoacyl-tRNA hydrolase [Streptomyces sp. EAG2]PKR46364.1 aminoacyl-tRNA hydrolase [Streptomyces sp. EAG2]
MTDDSPWLVVGLGNPGPEYAGNRHNVGFMVADLLASRAGGKFKAHKSRAQVLEARIGAPGPGSRRIVLAKPQSYMNLSGGPVTALRDFYKVPTERIVAIHDELDIDYGALRLKLGGGDNGHNGLKSMTKSLGPDYHRVRFGIGRPAGRMQVADFVLKDFSSTERKELDYFVDRAADAVEALVVAGLERAQSSYNS